jgi:hypothetical protein
LLSRSLEGGISRAGAREAGVPGREPSHQ